MSRFTFDAERLTLPKGAYAKTARRWLAFDGRRILALTAGQFRPYLFPLFSPAGYLLSSESPADHPHHNSCWAGSDHVHLLVPTGAGRSEEYTYNFYVNETFQGRSPGRQIEVRCHGDAIDDSTFRIVQTIDWRGPSEWAAPEGRLVLEERRRLDIRPGRTCHRIDILSEISAASDGVQLGPTRHAFFNARVAETMVVDNGGMLRSDLGTIDPAATAAPGARWVDFTGPVGGGARAGVTLIPHGTDGHDHTWFVAGWGVMTAGAFRCSGIHLPPGAVLQVGCSLLLHDGDLSDSAIDAVALTIPSRPLLQTRDTPS